MATYEILGSSGNYYTIAVRFEEEEFVQTIVSDKTEDELAEQLEAYALDYETQFLANR